MDDVVDVESLLFLRYVSYSSSSYSSSCRCFLVVTLSFVVVGSCTVLYCVVLSVVKFGSVVFVVVVVVVVVEGGKVWVCLQFATLRRRRRSQCDSCLVMVFPFFLLGPKTKSAACQRQRV
jgi:hypothetical protein